ncbi:hypothetical protein D046_0096B, partial [Vibrio parahaemolyticus V-223/04]
RLLVNHLKTL